jgi:hypothetical protein
MGDAVSEDANYFIKRFRFEGETTVVKTGLSLEEAREHCKREDTHGDGWFDGYTCAPLDDPGDYRQESES